MKFAAAAAALTALAASRLADAGQLQQTPMERVAQLLEQMKNRVEADGKLEQESYDKYACWCEDAMGRKANDITKSKEIIEEESSRIVKLKAEIASHGAEIQQTKKDIEANIEAQRDAAAVRDKDHETYTGEKTEGEQCSGALEAAIKVLAGAGEKKKAFLEQTLREAELLSVVAGVRSVLARPTVSKSVSQTDMEAVRSFIDHPDTFVGNNAESNGFLQQGNNPFGDYAPQSTQIQGILKGMYDTFVGDLEKNNAEEAEAQKSFEELMATKKRELEALQETLEQHELDEAAKTKSLADSNALRDDTEAQLAADEKLFEEIKGGCRVKATEWSQRTRMRTEELQGIGMAINILSSPEARQTFQDATTTFVQLSASKSRAVVLQRAAHIAELAQKHHSTGLAQLAAVLKSGGHFDKVMSAIDQMVEVLRREEQEDIEHRDRCQNAQGKNTNDMEDLNHDIDKATKSIERMESEVTQLNSDIVAVKDEINATRKDMDDALVLRNDDVKAFRKAVKDDTDAIALLEQASQALKKFFEKNKIKLNLAQVGQDPAPEYTQDPDKAPETTWSGGHYGGKKSETGGVVAIIDMIKEDLMKEIKTAQADDAEAQAQYEKERASMQKSLDAQMALKVAKERELNDVEAKIADYEDFKSGKTNDLNAESSLKDSIGMDCSWVETHFESRRTKRKAEMDGLAEAKSYLAGVESGDEM